MASRRAPALETIDDALVDEVASRIRTERAVKTTRLTAQKLTKRAQGMLFEALERRGFERTKSWVRVPLREQLASLLNLRAEVDLKEKGLLAGADGPAVKRAVQELCKDGSAVLLARGKREALVTPSGDVLSAEEIAALKLLAKELGSRLTAIKPKANGPKKVLSRRDIAALWTAHGPATARGSGASPAKERLIDLLSELESARHGAGRAVFVPDLARRMAPLPVTAVHAAILEVAESGEIELRPESGVGSLPAEDAALCLALPNGQLVSYVRRLRVAPAQARE